MSEVDLVRLDALIRDADAFHARMRRTLCAEQAAFAALAREFEHAQARICTAPHSSLAWRRRLIDSHARLVLVTREVSSLYDMAEMGMQQRLAAILACDPDLLAGP